MSYLPRLEGFGRAPRGEIDGSARRGARHAVGAAHLEKVVRAAGHGHRRTHDMVCCKTQAQVYIGCTRCHVN